MKKLNILLFPFDDRGWQASIPYHYTKLGHNVFIPKFGSPDLDWTRHSTWPGLLLKSQNDPTKRNIEIHGCLKGDQILFGEDCFLELEQHQLMQYGSQAACELIDLSKQKIHIDAFHTSRSPITELDSVFRFTKKYIPDAKWISSTFSHWDHNPGNHKAKNIVRVLPANYDSLYNDRNVCDFYNHHIEFELLDVVRNENSIVNAKRVGGFAGFNHNFHIRQPEGYKLFCDTNKLLVESGIQVENYGGNIRKYGADVRFSGESGVTGKYVTLSPRQAAKRYLQLDACVHFKNTDWGGGVPACCRFSGTPMITTQHFINMSRSNTTLIDGVNCVVVKSAIETADAIVRLRDDERLKQKLRKGMLDIHNSIFENENYWIAWEKMIANLE